MKMRLLAGLCLSVIAAGCGGHRRYVEVPPTQVPPRLDVKHYGRVGLVTFAVTKAKGSLHQLATARFSEAILDAQPGTEVLELGAADSLLRRVGQAQFGPAAAQSMGPVKNVPVVFAGEISVSDVKPTGRVLGINLPSIKATVTVELSVGLFSAETGGTLWRSSATATEEVGSLALIGGEPSFSAKDPNVAYGHLINRLVGIVTSDLRPTWERH